MNTQTRLVVTDKHIIAATASLPEASLLCVLLNKANEIALAEATAQQVKDGTLE